MKLTRLYISAVLPLSLIFMQATFGYAGSFPINIALVAVLLLVLVGATEIKLTHKLLLFFVGILAIVLFYSFWAQDLVEFIRSYMQILLSITVIAVSAGLSRGYLSSVKKSADVIIVAGFCVAFVIIGQAVLWNNGFIETLDAPLGLLAPRGPGGEVYVPTMGMLIKRPNGIYSEPSIAGWMMSYLASLAWILSRSVKSTKKKQYLLACIVFSIAAVSTGTVSGFLSIISVWLVILYIERINIKWFAMLLVLVPIVVVITAFTPIGEQLGSRFENATKPGTSIYFRVVAPLRLLSESLKEYPFGHPVGQTEYIQNKDYMVNWDGGSQTNIDNSFFLISYHFGWFGVFGVALLIIYLLRLILKRILVAPLLMAQVMALMATGALWSPMISLMLGYTIIVAKLLLKTGHTYFNNRLHASG